MLWPHAYGAAATARARSRLPALARPDRVEVGGREGRHALLRSARARCDQDRSAQPATSPKRAPRSRCRNAADSRLADRSTRPTRYRNFEIWKPANDQRRSSIPAAQVDVEVRVEPAAAGDAHVESLSRRQAGRGLSAQHDSSYALTEVPRGTHTLIAVIADRGRQHDPGIAAGHVSRATGIDRAAAGRSVAARRQPKPRRSGAGEQVASPRSRATPR